MSENPFANVYRKVTIDKNTFIGDPICDERMMMEDQKRHQDALAIEAYNATVVENAKKKWEQAKQWDAVTQKTLLENAKVASINQLAKELPTYIFGEAFAKIYMDALPHNRKYVMEHYGQFNRLAHMYVNKLGGYNYLKKVAATTESTFLKKLSSYIQEAAKNAVVKKNEKISKAVDEDEIKQMINPMIDPEEKNSLLRKVDSLGADELAELVNQKVLDVVNDERRKIKQDTEFKNMLKNDLDSDLRVDDSKAADTEPIDNKTDIKAEDNTTNLKYKNKQDANVLKIKSTKDYFKMDDNDDKNPGKKAKKDTEKELNPQELKSTKTLKEATMNMTFMEAFEKWDPVNGTFNYHPNQEKRTLFTSMMENVVTGFILNATGSTKRRRPSKGLYESAINLVAIEDMIPKEKTEYVSENDTVSTNVDKARVFSEVLTQYTLIETAHTMKLINVTPIEIAQQCEFLTTEYA